MASDLLKLSYNIMKASVTFLSICTVLTFVYYFIEGTKTIFILQAISGLTSLVLACGAYFVKHKAFKIAREEGW